jgi:hypothetical protein
MDRNNREFKRESLQVFVAVLSSVSFVPWRDALSLGTLTPTIWRRVLGSSSRFQGHRRKTE